MAAKIIRTGRGKFLFGVLIFLLIVDAGNYLPIIREEFYTTIPIARDLLVLIASALLIIAIWGVYGLKKWSLYLLAIVFMLSISDTLLFNSYLKEPGYLEDILIDFLIALGVGILVYMNRNLFVEQ